MRRIILTPDETGGYVAEVPSLPGCFSQGETAEETIANIKEAIALYIEVLIEDGRPVPAEDFQPAEGTVLLGRSTAESAAHPPERPFEKS